MQYELNTPEAISISYTVAGIGSRFVAAAIDILIQIVLLILIIAGFAGLSSLPGPASTVGAILLITLLFLLFWGYYLLFEAFWNGQTPGKAAVHIRVIKTSGHPIGFIESAIRNLIRIVDWLPSFYGIGVISMFVNHQARRLGDLAAGTIVVKVPRRSGAPAAPQAATPASSSVSPRGTFDPDESLWNLRALTSADLSLAEGFLDRVTTLPVEARQRVGEKIAATVAGRIGAREPADAAVFLRRVLDLQRTEESETHGPYSR